MNADDVKQELINKLGLRGMQRRRLIREGVANDWIDDPKKAKKKGQ